jgi:protein subunit release factor A
VTELDETEVMVSSWTYGRDFTVWVTHLPTGLRAECCEHESRLLNREQAMAELRRKVAELRGAVRRAG